MTTGYKTCYFNIALARVFALLAIMCISVAPALAQTTTGGTVISNQASATYTDGGGGNFSTVSNTVTVTVSNVSGLAITPDAGSNPSIVPGQTGVDFSFTVTNTSNFATQVRFLASGASIQLSGPATVTAAVIDVTNNGLGAGDTDIFGNAADVVSAAIARNASITVIVRVSVNAGAAAGSTINVRLGDAAGGSPTFDNQTANSSANEVRTSSGASAPVNGESEARGDIDATVQNDVQLRAVLTAPAGPVALGSDITYTVQLCNDGNRQASAVTLGAFTGVYIVIPVPVGTALSAANSFPAGTMLYTNSPLSTAPLAATWANSPAGTVTRVAINVGATLGSATCSGTFNFIATITTTNATTPIYEIIDGFGTNTIGATVTDQSGDGLVNSGDGNANFNEPIIGGTAVAGQGFQLITLLQQVGSVLIGPLGQPAAVGPTNSNDDYTNRSVTTGIAGVAPGGVTTAGCDNRFLQHGAQHRQRQRHLHADRSDRSGGLHRPDQHSRRGRPVHDRFGRRQRRSRGQLRAGRQHHRARHRARRADRADGLRHRDSCDIGQHQRQFQRDHRPPLHRLPPVNEVGHGHQRNGRWRRDRCSAGRGHRIHHQLSERVVNGRLEQRDVDGFVNRHHRRRQRRAKQLGRDDRPCRRFGHRLARRHDHRRRGQLDAPDRHGGDTRAATVRTVRVPSHDQIGVAIHP